MVIKQNILQYTYIQNWYLQVTVKKKKKNYIYIYIYIYIYKWYFKFTIRLSKKKKKKKKKKNFAVTEYKTILHETVLMAKMSYFIRVFVFTKIYEIWTKILMEGHTSVSLLLRKITIYVYILTLTLKRTCFCLSDFTKTYEIRTHTNSQWCYRRYLSNFVSTNTCKIFTYKLIVTLELYLVFLLLKI